MWQKNNRSQVWHLWTKKERLALALKSKSLLFFTQPSYKQKCNYPANNSC